MLGAAVACCHDVAVSIEQWDSFTLVSHCASDAAVKKLHNCSRPLSPDYYLPASMLAPDPAATAAVQISACFPNSSKHHAYHFQSCVLLHLDMWVLDNST